MTDDSKEFTHREQVGYEPGPCAKGHERRKADVVWQEIPLYSGRVQRSWLIERVDCPVCSRAPAEEGDGWRGEIE
ncbi:hypothetical protein [Umezawaea sp. Da 62-37]|uniref:hypothetical protein n=1 Tax=Umezawaea sp. Da 62-37 TaxID=3075927 RepID=UPI0028F714A4|nr:hypothetical protein [Umezawaea sp. Da 62-37]WNV83717.1 hypothetical protein RM788_36875 [Umezawaea sp. Da 62-37]